MHVGLIFHLSSDPTAAARELEALDGLPVIVAGTGSLAEELAAASVEVPSTLEWARLGWSAPWFPMLPEPEIDRQLVREAAAVNALGSSPGPLLIEGPWEPRLTQSFVRNSVPALLLSTSVTHRSGTGVVAFLDAILPVAGVQGEVGADVGDDLVVVRCPSPGAVRAAASSIVERPGHDLCTTGAFLADHRPAGRLHPEVTDWERSIVDPQLVIHHRKLVRLMTRIPDRISDDTERAILLAEAGDAFARAAPIPHRPLVEARRAVDDDRRRGQDWGKVSRLDWNADGREELHVELPTLSFVLVPHRSAALACLDVKRPIWPVSAVADRPGWDLVRFAVDGHRVPLEFEIESVEETKAGEVTVAMSAELDGGLLGCVAACVVDSGSGHIDLVYTVENLASGDLGPDLRLTMGKVRWRSDGSPWAELERAHTAAGHRLRLEDDDHRVSIESITPMRVALTPVQDGVEAWPHWATAPDGIYRISIRLDQSV